MIFHCEERNTKGWEKEENTYFDGDEEMLSKQLHQQQHASVVKIEIMVNLKFIF